VKKFWERWQERQHRPLVWAAWVMRMTERAELEKCSVFRVRNCIVAPKRLLVPSFRITTMIMPQNIIHVNTLQFRHRGEFRYRGEFHHRC
jgi:hypothetical protein